MNLRDYVDACRGIDPTMAALPVIVTTEPDVAIDLQLRSLGLKPEMPYTAVDDGIFGALLDINVF